MNLSNFGFEQVFLDPRVSVRKYRFVGRHALNGILRVTLVFWYVQYSIHFARLSRSNARQASKPHDFRFGCFLSCV